MRLAGPIRYALFPVLFLLFPSAASGYGFHDALTYGNTVDVVSLRSAGMGGIRVFGSDDASAVLINPASLSGIGRMTVSAVTSYMVWTEVVVDSTDRVQRSDHGLGVFSGALALPAGSRMVVAAGVAKVSDHRYDGINYLQENPQHPGVDIIETLESSGGLWEAVGGASWSLSENLSAGLSGGMRFGEVSYEYSFDRKFTAGIDSIASWSWDLAEPCFHAGFIVGDDLMNAGAAFTSGTADRYHSRLSIAGMARAEHIGNTTLGFEGEVADPFEGNYFSGKVFLETPIRRNISLMAGVGFNDGENVNRVGSSFSVGGTYDLDRLGLGFALSHFSRSRKSTSFPGEYSDHVDDSWTHVSVGLRYAI